MKDTELRWVVLDYFYNNRQSLLRKVQPKPNDFDPQIAPNDLYRICEQLSERGLLDWKSDRNMRGYIGGLGMITAAGVDAIETEGQSSPILLTIPMTQNINIHDSQGIQIGNQNIQYLVGSLQAVLAQIDASSSSPEEKKEAKGRLARFLEHPLVTSIVGGAAASLAEMAKQ